MNITSFFIVTEYKTTRRQRVEIEGFGQEAIKALRKEYPRWTKFVLEGFEINGEFKYLNI